MNCQQAREKLYDRLFDLLESTEQAALDQHLANCPACARALEQAKRETALSSLAARWTRFGDQILEGKRLHYSCGVGFTILAVGTKGGLYPCHRFVGDERFRMGDVFEGIDARTIYAYSTGYNPKGYTPYFRRIPCRHPALSAAQLRSRSMTRARSAALPAAW